MSIRIGRIHASSVNTHHVDHRRWLFGIRFNCMFLFLPEGGKLDFTYSLMAPRIPLPVICILMPNLHSEHLLETLLIVFSFTDNA